MLVDLQSIVISSGNNLQCGTDWIMNPAIMLGLTAYTQTFSADFRTGLDVTPYGPSTWTAHTPWYGDFGDAAFTDPQPGFPFQTSASGLTITAQRDSGGKWRSGLLSSMDPQGRGFSQAMGYFEARMKMPAGAGVWPAFWLHANGDGLYSAEIDVIEYYGQFDKSYVVTSQLWPKSQAGVHTFQQKIVQSNVVLSDSFHLYGVEITSELVTYFLDRVPVYNHPTVAQYKMPMSLLLDLGIGGGWPIDQTPTPSVLQVDYVKVFSRS